MNFFQTALILVFEVIVQPHGNIFWHFQVRPKSWKSHIVWRPCFCKLNFFLLALPTWGHSHGLYDLVSLWRGQKKSLSSAYSKMPNFDWKMHHSSVQIWHEKKNTFSPAFLSHISFAFFVYVVYYWQFFKEIFWYISCR